MAKQTWNNPIDKHTDWGGDATTGNLPVSGAMVQQFIKETLDGKAGVFYYDSTNNRYLVFTDNEARDTYLADPAQTSLILGSFDAPFNYTAEITLNSPSYNAVFLNSIGNYIDFAFDIKNKQGASTGENVNITYTFIRNATKKVVTELGRYGEPARVNVDKYLGEGTNTIIIGITGQSTLASTTVSVTYQVVNLTISDTMDISKAYDLSKGAQMLEIPFKVSGYGTKVVEWYVDGEKLAMVKSEDEIVDSETERTKRISISNLQQGKHSLQFRAYTLVNGERFETDTLYRDFLVYTGVSNKTIIGVALTIPRAHGVLGANDAVALYGMTQYVPYNLRFATYSPSNALSTSVSIYLGGELKAVIGSVNRVENVVTLVPTKSGDSSILLEAADVSYAIPAEIKKSSTSLEEITSDLVLDFNANGKNNYSTDKEEWSFGPYTGTFEGFNWNETSGWVNGRLEMNAGSSFAIDYAPLVNPTANGKTIEIEWSTKKVSNDDAVICDLRGEDGAGILITATKVSMISAGGVVIETEYKSEENVRVGFVINKASGVTNQRLSFIYANGILSRCDNWALGDSYDSEKQILFTATDEASISLKSIRIYDTALSSDQMLNNYTLYRDTLEEMLEVYDRNDVYVEGTSTFSPDKMMNRLPVMIITGDIPTLENTSDKDTQIVVDIEYHNMQDPSKSFTMKGAAMRPQGTSSMGYPKKNFRIYTQKVDGTILYDANGREVEDKLYSFTEKAQPVDCWCLKADYAESSGTHNTGIARLWNNALINAQVGGEYVCRTEAQKKAFAAGYRYDVRTTIDGFPILLFYRPSKNDDIIFIGKYNFNNDKSTESVFGFKGIPNFDNSRMQCWEVLNNGNALALFTSTEGFDENWAEAFESRYPDTSRPYTGDLKAFCEWMVNVSQKDFATQKWEHLNVYMMAAYWCYLMRHAAADQFVKNAMFTSEDGQHFYYILYDNDTINGLINTGRLRIKPTDDRQTVDEAGAYVFAGHDSRLWNMLEADEEFKNIVSAVDNALYSAGISYANTIKMFDEEQADKWVEKVYNQDSQYKYVGPYNERGIDNLFMLQGKRDLHRRWWLAKRFSIYDAKYVSGTYKSQAIEIKCINGTAAGQQFTVTAGAPLDYGYGINDVPREFGVTLEAGESHTFQTKEVVNLGDPIRIYGAPNIATLDFSKMSSKLAIANIANAYDDALGTKLTKLILGGETNAELSEISGLKQAVALEELDVTNMSKLTSLDLSTQKNFKSLKAFGSGITSVTFAKGAPVNALKLPASMRFLSLEQLPYLAASGISFVTLAELTGMSVLACPNVTNDFSLVQNWLNNKTTADSRCSLVMDNVDWTGVSGETMVRIASLGNVSLKGKIVLTDLTEEQDAILVNAFGNSVYDEKSELFIDAPITVTIKGDSSILEGEATQYVAKVFPRVEGTLRYNIQTPRTGCSINIQSGVLETLETGANTSDIVVRATFFPANGEDAVYAETTTSIVKRTYPSNVTIEGDGDLLKNTTFSWATTTPEDEINGEFSVEWSLLGKIASYYDVINNGRHCTLSMKETPQDTTNGSLCVTLKKRVDNSTTATFTLPVLHKISWLSDAIIVGSSNPVENNVYTWQTISQYSGVIKAEWSLSGEIVDYVRIESQDNESCVLGVIDAPVEPYEGVLTLTIKKAYNNAVLITRAKTLIAVLEGVVITSKGNAPIQAALYKAGLVANEKYSLQEEVEKITAEQLNPKGTYDGSIFYDKRNQIINFDEFEYFTGVTSVKTNLFNSCSSLTAITLPKSINSIEGSAFYGCSSLAQIYIPNATMSISNSAFDYCRNLDINVSEENSAYSSENGVLYDKNKAQLLLFRKDLKTNEYNVPNGVTVIGERSFFQCSSLVSIALPETLQIISSTAFNGCSSLKSITCQAQKAPNISYYSFGDIGSWAGSKTASQGTNFLFVSMNATGYESGYWFDPLQNAGKCGFSIYGRLKITSNKPSATFNVTYVTTSGASKTITMSPTTVYLNDVQYDTEMTISVTSDGTPEEWSTKTFTYNKDSQEHTCDFIIGTWIIINNGVIDPDEVITGDVNGEHVRLIRQNSHRYLAKKTAEGEMTICQLDDNNSLYYADGGAADHTGREGSVFMKLPRFWYYAVQKSDDVWKVGFYYGDTKPEGTWNEWDGKDLIGVYKASFQNKLNVPALSVSGEYPDRATMDDWKTTIKRNGTGYSMVKLKHHNMMAFLFFAMYGTTYYTGEIGGSGESSSTYITGQTSVYGMVDYPKDTTEVANNFWGLECWTISGDEFIGNIAVIDGSTCRITEDNGSNRDKPIISGGNHVSKIFVGQYLDVLVESTTSYYGSSNSYFCASSLNTSGEGCAYAVRYGFSNNNKGCINIRYSAESAQNSTRLCFRGTIKEEKSSSTFKNITDNIIYYE